MELWLAFFGMTGLFIFSAGMFYASTNTSIKVLTDAVNNSNAEIRIYVETKLTEITEKTEKRYKELADEMNNLKIKIEVLTSLRREK